MATITLPPALAGHAFQSDGTTAIPDVNPTNPSLPRWQPPIWNLPVNAPNGLILTPQTASSQGDRSAYGGPITPTGATREPNPVPPQSAQRTARLAGAAFPKDT